MPKLKKISVIVPVYNIKEFVEDCIDSIVGQMREGIEVIIVDDGSIDGSSDICDRIASQYEEVRVLHKKNGGLSDARNAGMKNACGEYIIFLDGDDTLVSGSVDLIMTTIEEYSPDLLTCRFKNIYDDGDNQQLAKRYIYSINDYLEVYGDIPWAAWRNIYKASIIKENNLAFKKGLVGAEDCEFFVRYFEKCKRIINTNILLVNYRVDREGSITNKITYEAIHGQLETFETNYRKFDNEKNDRIRDLFAKKYVNTITSLYNLNDKRKIRQLIASINNNRDIISAAKGKKYFIARIVFAFFGYYEGSRVLKRIKGVICRK